MKQFLYIPDNFNNSFALQIVHIMNKTFHSRNPLPPSLFIKQVWNVTSSNKIFSS